MQSGETLEWGKTLRLKVARHLEDFDKEWRVLQAHQAAQQTSRAVQDLQHRWTAQDPVPGGQVATAAAPVQSQTAQLPQQQELGAMPSSQSDVSSSGRQQHLAWPQVGYFPAPAAVAFSGFGAAVNWGLAATAAQMQAQSSTLAPFDRAAAARQSRRAIKRARAEAGADGAPTPADARVQHAAVLKSGRGGKGVSSICSACLQPRKGTHKVSGCPTHCTKCKLEKQRCICVQQ